MIERLIHRIRIKQAELQAGFAAGVPNWDLYQRLVGQHDGLQFVLNMVDDILEEEKNQE